MTQNSIIASIQRKQHGEKLEEKGAGYYLDSLNLIF